ncbi:MAG: TerB family tellurite resistance protein [Reichenbachiella sp.]
MSVSTINTLLLRTAFSFMTCDGHIDKKEIVSIMRMAQKNYFFGEVEIDIELEDMLGKINLRGTEYLKDYFRKVSRATLTLEEQLLLVQVAVDIIYADMEVRESEVKFLRVLRTMLDVSDTVILEKFPQLAKDFMWDDEFTEDYVKELYQNYFKHQVMPTFNIDDVIDITKEVIKDVD